MSDFLQFAVVLAAALVAVYYTGHGPYLLRKTTEIVYGKPGCAPVPKIGNVTIHYFAARGRAEPIRLMLEEAEIIYNETLFTKETWPAAKQKGIESGLYTFGQVPAITTTSGIEMVQSQAIVHYIGRSTGMECDCQDLHFCEVVALAIEDIGQKLSKVVWDVDFSAQLRDDYLKNVAPIWLGYLDKIAPCITAQDTAFFASERLTWVDFLVFNMLDIHVELANVQLPGFKVVDILTDYSRLLSFYNQFKARQRIAAYLESPRRSAYKLPHTPAKPGGAPPQQKKPIPTPTAQTKKQVPPTQGQAQRKAPEPAKVKATQERVPKPTSEQKKASPPPVKTAPTGRQVPPQAAKQVPPQAAKQVPPQAAKQVPPAAAKQSGGKQ
ncbi:glutathione S-transferase P 1-like [Glandiceps talaboti]